MDKIESKIEKLERKIQLAEEKLNKYQEKLENATEEQSTIRWEKLLDSASQTLHDLREEKVKLMEKELKLIDTERDLQKMQNSAQYQPKASLWRVTGTITGVRKVGFRRGLYRTSQDYLGFYEKKQGNRENPFAYRENDVLAINVLFEDRSGALRFRAAVYDMFLLTKM